MSHQSIMDLGDPQRRAFIKGLGSVSLAVVYAGLFGGCERLLEKIRNRPVRRQLRTNSPEVQASLNIYREAVAQMKALPAGDPRSWDAQAALHGTTSAFNYCEHGTNHFFSWHRAYLAFFEQICRNLTGEQDFGLPYWNWNQTPAVHPDFTAAGSPLLHPRNSTSVGNHSAFSNDTLDTILGDTNFFTYSSQVEGTPHNTAHVIVGQDMVTGASPRDPIFWAHHCMVDYCWAKWNIELGNDNTNDSAWLETTWDHFVDGQGNAVSVSAAATVLMPLLSYRYESSAIGGFAATMDLAARSASELRAIERRLRTGADVRFRVTDRIPIVDATSIAAARPFSSRAKVAPKELQRVLEQEEAEERVLATIDYARLPPTNDFFVRVFINLPGADQATPTDDPHYAGSFAFFGTDGASHGSDHRHESSHGKTDFLVDVTPTLRKLRRMDRLGAGTPISIQLIVVPSVQQLAMPEMSFDLQGLSLAVSPLKVKTD